MNRQDFAEQNVRDTFGGASKVRLMFGYNGIEGLTQSNLRAQTCMNRLLLQKNQAFESAQINGI